MTYRKDVKLMAELFQRINFLLGLDLDSMTDDELKEADAKTDDTEGIFEVSFKDGSRFTYDLRSGTSNYYDDMVFYDPKGYPTTLECDFELGEEIEFENNGNTYIINIILEW